LGLVFLLSIGINLIVAHFLLRKSAFKYKLSEFITGNKLISLKIIVVIFIAILLIPTISAWDSLIYDPPIKSLLEVPGGNEKNLQLWLYENTKKTDLILTDYSLAAENYVGFRAQPMLNGNLQWRIITNHAFYNIDTKTYEPIFNKTLTDQRTANSLTATLSAGKILNNAWDYENIEQTLKELEIDYVYISERKKLRPVGTYPDDFSWQNYAGRERIAMYENHPNLELILRNGNSAIFKVI